LALWKESVARRSSVATSVGEETASGRGDGGDDVSWDDTNLIRLKIKKITQSIQLLQIDDEDLKQQ
jgi:hypothetical protein